MLGFSTTDVGKSINVWKESRRVDLTKLFWKKLKGEIYWKEIKMD